MALDGCQIATVSAARGCTRFSFLPARHWKPCAPTDLLVLSRRLKCVRYILHPLFSWQFSNHPSEPFREISSEKLARKRYFKYTYTQSILKSCIVFFFFFFLQGFASISWICWNSKCPGLHIPSGTVM